MTVTLYFENYLVEIYRLWLYDDYNQDVYPDYNQSISEM